MRPLIIGEDIIRKYEGILFRALMNLLFYFMIGHGGIIAHCIWFESKIYTFLK